MKRKNQIKRLFIIYFIALIYPFFKGIKENSLLPITDSLFLMSMIVLLFGIMGHVGRLGTFDPAIYIFKKNLQRYNKSYEVYLEDVKEKKKDSFNYPLYLGILLLITSIIINLFI